MSAEAIARVIRDFKRRNIIVFERDNFSSRAQETVISTVARTIEQAVVVDITPVYRDFVEGDKPYQMYEDSICRPPWWYFAMAYENDHGNVNVMASVAVDREEDYESTRRDPPYARSFDEFSGLGWSSENIGDWSTVRWVIWTTFWIGGRAQNKTVTLPTCGPMLNTYIAVGEDGQPRDIHWMIEESEDLEHFEGALCVMLQALTILNCRNVEVMDPVSRPKAERKRVARTGVTVSEIHVMPMGKYRRRNGQPQRLGEGVPLHTVRGHRALYGPKYGRGLLFGKYEGEYWIPAFAKGTPAVGEVQHEYTVER